jgi:cell division septal protein FtsQ
MFARHKNKIPRLKMWGEKKAAWGRRSQPGRWPSLGRILFYLLVITFFVAVGYLLFFSPFLTINKIIVSGTENISQTEVQDFLAKEITGKYLGFIPKDNLLLVFSGRMEKKLSEKFNRIETVKLKKTFPETMEISLEEKKFQLIFLTGEQEYLIDMAGRPWSKADFALTEKEKELIIFTDESGKIPEKTDWIFARDLLQYILAVQAGLKNEADLETNLHFFSPRLISGDLKVEIKSGWQIYFNQGIDLEKSLETLKTVLREKINPADRENLEYIDLRINNKVYYKLKAQTEKAPEKAPEKKEEKKK